MSSSMLFCRVIIFALRTGSPPLFSSPGGQATCKVLVKTPPPRPWRLDAALSSFPSFPIGGVSTFGVDTVHDVLTYFSLFLTYGKIVIQINFHIKSYF